MKALVSRQSHRPNRRYSGVYHIQGAMVTDADLDERSVITRERTDNLGDDAIKDGVPAIGGAVVIGEDGKAALREGVIYADGVRGVLAAAPGAKPEKPLDIFTAQADLPFGPALPAGDEVIVYADIWERPVFPLEDPYLADAGLHGAVTGFRTRTMTQLKAAPADAEKDIEAGTGAFPRIGTARLKVTPLNAEILADDCDPCAEVVSAEQQVANALWRLEIVSIEGTPDKPGTIVLAWSEENAAEIAPATVSAEVFERANKVYEFFSPITESRAGVHADASDARLPAFVDDLGTNPVPAKDHNGEDWPFVRRWDGVATIDADAGAVGDSMGGGFELSAAGTKITLRVTAFEAELDLADAAVVPGDYWLVEMRRHAPEGERIRLVRETPVGILHHYCTLVTAKGDEIGELGDARRRKLSFPFLSDLPADHVGFENNCPKLYDDAENVQEALDNLCAISAEDIGFTSNCPSLYDDADNVQDALDALCRIDFSVHDSFRLLFDWGVICGIVPKLLKISSGLVSISAGAYLDRSGRITKFEGIEFDLDDLKLGETIAFKSLAAFQEALLDGKACLALAADEGGKTGVYLVPEAIAYGPADPGFAERVRACVERKKIVDYGAIVAKLPARQKAAATKILLASSGDGALRGSARFTRAQFSDAEAANDKLVAEFGKVASDEEIEMLNARIDQARKDNPTGNLTGAALEIRFMQQATAVFAAISETDQERLRRCICENLFPACPPELGKAPFFVPIACVRGSYEQPRLFLTEICPYCCRKQAMTWRSLQYFIGDMRERLSARFAELCCADRRDVPKPGLALDPKRFAALDVGRFVEDYKLVNTFLDRPEKLPSDYVAKVPVNDLSIAEATATLKGTGVEVAETIDVDDAKALDAIEGKLAGVEPIEVLASAGEVRPGDKVGLLVQDGVARGYVLLERGTGKLPFEEAKVAKVAFDEAELGKAEDLVRNAGIAREDLIALEKTRDALAADIDGLKAEAATLETERAAAGDSVKRTREELTALAGTRETLATEIARLKEAAETVSRERAETDAALGKARDQLTELARTRETLSAEIASATTELRAAESSHKALIESVRVAQPVNAVVGNENGDLVAKLAGAGIVSTGDIARLTATQIRRLDRDGILKETEANELKRRASDFLKQPI